MPPMILSGSESPISRPSSPDIFQPAPEKAKTIFKHAVPFENSPPPPPPQSNIIVAIPAKLPPASRLGVENASRFSTIDSDGIESVVQDSSSATEDRNIRPSTVTESSFRRKAAHSKGRKSFGAGTPATQITNSETNNLPLSTIRPRSKAKNFIPPYPLCTEHIAVRDLLAEIEKQKLEQPSAEASDIEFELSEFSIYLPDNTRYNYEFRGLQHLATRVGCSSFHFDGILSVGDIHRYVSAVPFQICSIGNYGEDIHEVDSDIWLQSNINTKANIYYRLKAPAAEYKEYHDGFVWLANLAKHFVDYCQAAPEGTVVLRNFQSDFSKWLRIHHESSPAFQSWFQQYGKNDFRRHIVVNIRFLFKECVGVNEELRTEPIFNELIEMNSIPQQQIKEEKTIVTPYVYECFKHIRFGHHLKSMGISSTPRTRQLSQGGSLDLTVDDYVRPSHVEVRIEIPSSVSRPLPRTIQTRSPLTPNAITSRQRMIANIKFGDVVSVVKDGQGSLWKDEVSRWKTADDCWYVCVQAIHKAADGTREFDGLWLYKPSDTSCAKMKYPYQNELFLSDNCTCSQKRILEEEVLDMAKVVWNGRPSERDQRLFIRQTYLENERFVTLTKAHKRCKHVQAKAKKESTSHSYRVGQTVLVPPPRKSKHALEPYEIVKFIGDGEKDEFAVLRLLQRRQSVDGKGRPNELVYTEIFDKIPVRKIEGTCLVRFYKESDIVDKLIPAPYSRDGTGNAFYITTRLVEVNGIGVVQPIDHNLPPSLQQGFDPLESSPRLRGMDLYCGGGNFRRGLEEGGAVRNEWAVDIERNAIHTYAANLPDPTNTKIFFGSVNDLLSQALRGNPEGSNLIPSPGEVHFISAGSPCQGFSSMNPVKNNEQGLRNQSLVASVAAYVDFYRPKYGILENVMTMAQKGRGRDEDVLSQLICAIVGLGYQLRMFVVDSWSCGMPQNRTRLFVSFAAPGLEPLEHPKLSHSHPPNRQSDRTLGLMANGEAFGRRIHGPTPFAFVSAEEGVGDLPSIGNGSTYHCTLHPYHTLAMSLTAVNRAQLEAIPKFPRSMNFTKAWDGGKGVLTPEQAALFPIYDKYGKITERCSRVSKGWGVIHPKGLIPIILSQMWLGDSRGGPAIHWDEPRILTLMEGARAQGFLDDEILLGTTSQAFKILGNSVARGVSLALGLALHEAWLKNGPVTPESPRPSSPIIIANSERVREPRKLSPVTARRSRHVISFEDDSTQVQDDLTRMLLSEDELSESESSERVSVGLNHAGQSMTAGGLSSSTINSRSTGQSPRASANFIDRSIPGSRVGNTPTLRRTRDISVSTEADLSDDLIGAFTNGTEQQTPASEFSTDSRSYGKEKASKKPLGVRLGEILVSIPERSTKRPRIELSSLPASSQTMGSLSVASPVVSPSRNGQPKTLSATALAKKLSDLQKSSSIHNRRYSALPLDSPEESSESDEEDVKFIPGTSSSIITSASNANRKRKLPEPNHKPSSEPAVVISLLSDDDEEDNRFEGFRYKPPQKRRAVEPAEKPIYPLPPPQVPVGDGGLAAYGRTNTYMNFAVNRRHGPKSSW